jgi:two-component system LytT family sensor kinase
LKTLSKFDETGGIGDETGEPRADTEKLRGYPQAGLGGIVKYLWRRFFLREWQPYWRLDIAALILLLALGVLMRVVFIRNPVDAVLLTLLVDPVTLIAVVALQPLFAKLRLDFSFTPRPVALATLLFVSAAFVETAWARLIISLTGMIVPTWGVAQNWIAPWVYFTIILVGWSLGRFWILAETATHREQQRAIAAESEALKAELHHLRHQLDPHFLFNALNGIASEISERPDAAINMVHELADYLRYSLDHRNLTVSRFVSEINAVRSYLEVQKSRFGSDLQFRFQADETARAHRTPSFLLQPLVENAVKHGLKAGATPLDIVIDAKSDGASLNITVAGNGTLRPDWRTAGSPGVGLSVLRRRLELHYPGRHEFDMRQTGGKVAAELKLQGEPCSA